MTQSQIDAAVAVATGESRRTIAELGFVLLTNAPIEVEPDRPPLWIDWDELTSEQEILVR